MRHLHVPHPSGACGVQIRSRRICRTVALWATELEFPGAQKQNGPIGTILFLARPERFELPTTWFEARYSIQLSYGRIV